MSNKPLAGIRVLDLTRLLPGPVCSLHLADLGADVIKIEDPGPGDYSRHRKGGEKAGPAPVFGQINRNKRSLKLDLKQADGVQAFMDLVAESHVVLEGFRPGVMARLGIDYARVRARNSGIVFCSISGYGQDGPLRDVAGHDINYCGYAGVLHQSGARGGPPTIPNLQIADLLGGALSAVMGILAALVDAQRSGEGRYVDVAMTDCTLAHNVVPFARATWEGEARPRGEDALNGGLPCYGVYETADGGYMALGALESKFWQAFCEAVARPDLIEHHMVSGETADRVRGEVAQIFRSSSRDAWVERLAGVDCCASPVLSPAEARHHPHMVERGMFVTSDDADIKSDQLAFPLHMSDFVFSVERPAPGHGEHSREILAQIGYDEERIAELQNKGVI
ncbi:MAG: CoA transferase [Gammaproteobacteria bacterium]|nr:CoA transferase [Gammaproteobacteria bacterium]